MKHLYLVLLSLVVLCLFTPMTAPADFYMKVDPDGCIVFTNVPNTGGFVMIYDELEDEYVTYDYYYYSVSDYDTIINTAAMLYAVDPSLIKAVIKTESNFDPNAMSNKGACGLMQLIPETAERFSVTDIFDPRQNIYGGTEYLSYLLNLFKGDTELALAGYNAGENAVIKYDNQIPPYKETQNYVKKVLKFWEYYR
ncbi:MAG: lytic transglycosylase domain-containing protein [Deltaproteobacteria bacterium]|nr:lytic transglycosylase domain-containing protein [Candidatus Zymogenaceae bacterium]